MVARIRKGAAAADATCRLVALARTPDGTEAVGPLWLGPLQSAAFVARCLTSAKAHSDTDATRAFERNLADAPGLPPFTRRVGSQSPVAAVEALRAHGHSASRSAFDPQRVRSSATEEAWAAAVPMNERTGRTQPERGKK